MVYSNQFFAVVGILSILSSVFEVFGSLGTNFHDFWCLGRMLEIIDFHGDSGGDPRSKQPTWIVVISALAGSLTSTYQYLLRANGL